ERQRPVAGRAGERRREKALQRGAIARERRPQAFGRREERRLVGERDLASTARAVDGEPPAVDHEVLGTGRLDIHLEMVGPPVDERPAALERRLERRDSAGLAEARVAPGNGG